MHCLLALTFRSLLQHLSLATSLAKLVDLEQALGHQDAAAANAEEAQRVLLSLKQTCQLSDAATARAATLERIVAPAS